jgi:hypothetical protein
MFLRWFLRQGDLRCHCNLRQLHRQMGQVTRKPGIGDSHEALDGEICLVAGQYIWRRDFLDSAWLTIANEQVLGISPCSLRS